MKCSENYKEDPAWEILGLFQYKAKAPPEDKTLILGFSSTSTAEMPTCMPEFEHPDNIWAG